MGRAGFQHRWEYGQDTDGFQPIGSGETEVHNANTTCSYPDAYPHLHTDANSHTFTHGYSDTCAKADTDTYGHGDAQAYFDAYAKSRADCGTPEWLLRRQV